MADQQSIQTSARREETIGSFLLRRLSEMGIQHVFGVAGDFNLEFLEQLTETNVLSWVGCCNELNAAYAADGHARTMGVAALVTTYGVGELSALCGVAGSYCEHVPVVHIAGAPPLAEINRHGLLHHTAGDGDYGNMLAAARPFSVAQARIEPQNAVSEIDRCLRACVLQKRPVYLQLPSDVAYTKVRTPAAPLTTSITSDTEILEDFVRAAATKMVSASSIAILADADISRFEQGPAILALAEKLCCPVAVMSTAKAALDETSPHYIGVYSGAYSKPEVRETIEQADCLLMFAVRFTDSTTGSFSQKIFSERTITIDDWRCSIHPESFEGIAMKDAIESLTKVARPQAVPFRKRMSLTRESTEVGLDQAITQAWFWRRVQDFIEPEDVVVAENGTSLSGVEGLSLPARTIVLAQALWGSIGYSLPACFGSLIAKPQRRHLLFIGDGSFQLTAQELSSVLRHKLKPIIFLINNDGYTIERLILGEDSSYNDIQPWKYAALCEVFANGAPFVSRRVQTVGEIENALAVAKSADNCYFIEVVMPRMDAPQSLRQLGPVYAKQDYGKSWERRAQNEA